MIAEDIKSLIEANLSNSTALVSGEDGQHFQAIVISDEFMDKRPVARQQAVYAALGDNITNGTIHALALKTFTQEEWQTQQA